MFRRQYDAVVAQYPDLGGAARWCTKPSAA